MKNTETLKKEIEKVFFNIPLDGNVLQVRENLMHFIDDNFQDFETIPQESGENQDKFILIEFE